MAEINLQKGRELLVKQPSVGHDPKGLWAISKEKVSLRGAFFVIHNMPKDLSRYYQAWQLRQKGNTFKEIAEIMGIHKSRANILVHFIDYKIKAKKPISNELKELINKFRPSPH